MNNLLSSWVVELLWREGEGKKNFVLAELDVLIIAGQDVMT